MTVTSAAVTCAASAPRSVPPELSSSGRDFAVLPPSRRSVTPIERTGDVPILKIGCAVVLTTLRAIAVCVQPVAVDGQAEPGVVGPMALDRIPSNQIVRVAVSRHRRWV